MMIVIGLTGGIASGKSTVSKMIETAGIPVIDADAYAKKVVEPGERAYEEIVAHFGEAILHGDGTIDRKKLGAIIFNDEKERKVLNGIVHPAVRKGMIDEKARHEKEGHEAVVLDIPLLFESKLQESVDHILLVYVDEDVQLKRLMERDGSTKEEALSRIRSQIPLKAKRTQADAVIDNNGTEAETEDQLNEILKGWNVKP
ncbi:MAG TPA: dephospho-CoA kinase [Bacillales bacterium]|nr:dephospho-CoA kinase [Bacillales bacterium]